MSTPRAARWLAAVVGALAAGGCAPDAPPAAAPAATALVHTAPAPAPALPRDGAPLETAASRVARSATRWLYARHRGAVTVAPATASYRRALSEVHIPSALRGRAAHPIDVRAIAQTPDTALVSWTVVDDRSRYPIVATMMLRGGRWRAVEHNAD